MPGKPLEQVVRERPFPEYATWWPIGGEFTAFMSDAIVNEWRALQRNGGEWSDVQENIETYLQTVYGRSGRSGLLDEFLQPSENSVLQSGEFDALSYAFYKSAFERIAGHIDLYSHSLERERRLFTIRVGKTFFDRLRKHLDLELPHDLATPDQVREISDGIGRVGRFLHDQGYLRSHFAFRFDVDTENGGARIVQQADDVVQHLHRDHLAYALYEMGYPVILPSAVYLYHTIGEAQHHSSRTIENLFAEVGYDARETDDFDPIGYPSEMVVELWEIRKG